MVWFVFLPWLCGVQAQEEKETLRWFCFPCEEEVERVKKRRRKKENLKHKQAERDSPLLVWFGKL